MIVQVDLDAARAIERIGRGHKLPFIAVRAINDTGKAVQAAVREQLPRAFTVRKPGFLSRQVKYFGASFSSATGNGRWEARVGVGIGKELAGSPLLLPRFEAGATRSGAKGGGVAVPVVGGARPGQTQPVAEQLFIRRLQLRRPAAGRSRKRKAGGRGRPIREGLLGTFQIPGVGILQRTSAKVARLLYAFKPTVRLPARLGFYRTAKRVIQADFARNVQKYVNEAFARHG